MSLKGATWTTQLERELGPKGLPLFVVWCVSSSIRPSEAAGAHRLADAARAGAPDPANTTTLSHHGLRHALGNGILAAQLFTHLTGSLRMG